MKLFIASNNPDKTAEIKRLFLTTNIQTLDIRDAKELGGMPVVEENGSTYKENALLKANALNALSLEDSWVLADDSGLEVDALQGAPGIYAARFAGENVTYQDNNQLMLSKLKGVPYDKRSARMVCCMVLLSPEGKVYDFMGICNGFITEKPKGDLGFGYDPIFQPKGYENTFSEMGPSQKNKISHRAMALAQVKEWVESYLKAAV